ncbi:acyltransferase [Candidatus Desulfobacillus denitrificans]|jgi:nitrilase|uniref:Acyltransferase n=1 Tax=Candidatus Desulfobacillus denitrificans TaxID=2608985 RepID=A0A809RKV6_9PROT|nr:carbon-nitrogen hydrolase family protein [Rhodocyclaceae bacterium]BBO20102.1 acyltransferase [Candidatus Desulfobacillus denitrificans]
MTPIRIAAVQMVSGPDIAQNLREAERLVAEAAARGARLVALPEYFPLISGSETDKVRAREKDGAGPLQDFLRETALRHRVWLVGGSIPLEAAAPEKVRNSCLVFDAAGRRVARYDKIHLFGFRRGTEQYDESRTIEAGGSVVAFDSPFGRVGLSICYDLRFPELYRAMGTVDLLVVPAAFTHTTGQAHWELLLRARAVENLCYVLAAAQGGTHPSGRRTWGDSMVVDPWGAVLERLPEGPGVVSAEMDTSRIAELRASLPALEHRRFF